MTHRTFIAAAAVVLLSATALGWLLGPPHLVRALVSAAPAAQEIDPWPGYTIVPEQRGPLRSEVEAQPDAARPAKRAEITRSAVPDAFGFTGSGHLFTISNLRRENANSIHMEVQARVRGELVYDDFLRIVNPPILIPTDPPTYHIGLRPIRSGPLLLDQPAPILNFIEDPYIALRAAIVEAVLTTVKDGPHLPARRGTTTSVYADTGDGFLYADNGVSWANLQAGGGISADTTSASSQWVWDGSYYAAFHWTIGQLAFGFDTSAIGSDTIDDVTFSQVSNGLAGADTAGTLEVRVKDWSGSGLTTADWTDLTTASNWTGLPYFASLAQSSWTSTDLTRNTFTEESGAAGNINGSGTTYVMGLLSGAYGSEPTINNDYSRGVYFADQAGTTSDPLLVVNHTAGGGGGPRRRVTVTIN